MLDTLKTKYKNLSRITIIALAPLYLIACGGGVTGDSDNFITVKDQSVVELNEINIANTMLNTNAWIVIYEQDSLLERKGDNALAQRSLTSGEYENVTIMLNRDVAHGEVLYAELRRDDGNVGVYEPNIDSVISQSATTAASFVVNYSTIPYIAADDQQISSAGNNTIQVKKIISVNAAWLVAYRYDENAENNIGERVGYQPIRHLEESVLAIHQSKVNIGLETTLSAGDELIIVLYEDKVVDDGGFSKEEDILVLNVDNTVMYARITILDSAVN